MFALRGATVARRYGGLDVGQVVCVTLAAPRRPEHRASLYLRAPFPREASFPAPASLTEICMASATMRAWRSAGAMAMARANAFSGATSGLSSVQ